MFKVEEVYLNVSFIYEIDRLSSRFGLIVDRTIFNGASHLNMHKNDDKILSECNCLKCYSISYLKALRMNGFHH